MNQHTMIKNALMVSTVFLLPVMVAGNCSGSTQATQGTQKSKKRDLEAISTKWLPASKSIISLASKIIQEERKPTTEEQAILKKNMEVLAALHAEVCALKASKQEEESWFEGVHRQEQDLHKQYGISEEQVDNFIDQYVPNISSSVAKKRDEEALESVRRVMLELHEEIVSIVSKIINENRASTTEEETTLKRKLAYEKFQGGKFIYWGSSRGEQEKFSNDADISEAMFCTKYGITRDQFVAFMKMKGLFPSCA